MNWLDQARCRTDQADFDAAIDIDRQQYLDRAKAICKKCPVTRECLDDVLSIERKVGVQWGVWGGKTRRERIRQLAKRAARAA